MGDKMLLYSMEQLLNWISQEYQNRSSVFGIPVSQFFRKKNNYKATIFGQDSDTFLGPAAGPHTQIAQNLITAYLCGGRFLELKTVQKLDNLVIPKPCIDALDEGYNTEWSTELSLEEAYEEYAKAWIIISLLSQYFHLPEGSPSNFIFNMSLGYDLEGIQSPAMDRFINRLMDSKEETLFTRMLDEADQFLSQQRDFWGKSQKELREIIPLIPVNLVQSVTLSTMHGCPPSEIEKICAYLITQKNLNTYVKLNPTLLGFDKTRKTLDSLGYNYVELKRESFTKDLQMEDAVPMIRRLKKLADSKGKFFGLKLSNTLGVRNYGRVLPGEEKYMSGRALYPLTITLASLLANEFNGLVPISFSGGISQYTVLETAKCGIRPITMATALLKPGGYSRISYMADIIDAAWDLLPNQLDKDALSILSERATNNPYSRKIWRGTDKVSVPDPLPLLDCAIAPCIYACPIGQDAPEYIRLTSEKRYSEALALIYAKNPLPHITGYICDHVCMANCTRLDYDGPVRIREIKRIAAQKGYLEHLSNSPTPPKGKKRVAVLGAGPSGLACAYFLRKAGVQVTIFEKESNAGGIINTVLPSYRIPLMAVEKDIDFLAALGVHFKFDVDPVPSFRELFKQNYSAVYVATGASKERSLDLGPEASRVYGVIDFLKQIKLEKGFHSLGKRVAVIGGGNSAMDGARSALRIPGVERVYIIYRRSEAEIPAEREEFELAKTEGAVFLPLLTPVKYTRNSILVCRKIILGERGRDGRRIPVETEETVEIPVDSVITALGEEPDRETLLKMGLTVTGKGTVETQASSFAASRPGVFAGGDVRLGASSVVKALADGRGAAEEILSYILKKSGKEILDSVFKDSMKYREVQIPPEELIQRKGLLYTLPQPMDDLTLAKREEFRCLHCGLVCNKCVDVCPNRANIALDTQGKIFKDRYQILHLDDPCNECGNCYTFCPFEGRPYKDKLTLFSSLKTFEESENNGAFFPDPDKADIRLRLGGEIYLLDISQALEQEKSEEEYSDLEKVSWLFSLIFREYHYLLERRK